MSDLILHIDDSEFVLQFVNRGLTKAGFRVASISDLSRIPDVLADQGMPNLILLDINMPEAQGDDLAQFFTTKWQLAIPIVLFSDLPRDEIANRAKRSGATTFVKKEDGIARLIEVIQKNLAQEPPAPEPSAVNYTRFNATADAFVKRLRQYVAGLDGKPEAAERCLRNIQREVRAIAGEARLRGPKPLANLLAAAERFCQRAARESADADFAAQMLNLADRVEQSIADPAAEGPEFAALLEVFRTKN